MGTFLFSETVFGPVKSRRLGISLGINLLPNDSKVCNFNCIYCECGWSSTTSRTKPILQTRTDVNEKLIEKLVSMNENKSNLDVITFAGNGEPTIHPEFADIINDTISARDKYFPKAKIAVLSNATQLHRQKVFNALKKIDDNILKLDSAFENTIMLLNGPHCYFDKNELINNLKKFKGDFILQTMFVKGTYKKHPFDNTNEKEIEAWLSIIKKVKPKKVMIYTISRDTPSKDLEKISLNELNAIAKRVEDVGFETLVSG